MSRDISDSDYLMKKYTHEEQNASITADVIHILRQVAVANNIYELSRLQHG